MNEELFENIEWLLSVAMQLFCCMGMFFTFYWFSYLFCDSLSVIYIIAVFLISVVLTIVVNELRLEMRYRHLLMKAQREKEKASLPEEQEKEADALYEHLEVL